MAAPRPVVPFRETQLDANAKDVVVLSLREPCESRWTVIQIDSTADKAPIDCAIQFSGGEGPPGAILRITVARSTLVCLPSSALNVLATNLSVIPTKVLARVHQTDLPLATQNVWSTDGDGNGALTTVVIAAYAKTVRLDVSDVPSRLTSFLELLSPGGVLVGRSTVDELPPEGLPIGHCELVRVLVPVTAAKYRITFFLSV